jgi:hypothetical protein
MHAVLIGGIDSNGAIGAVNCLSFRTPFSPNGGKNYFRIIVSYICIIKILCTLVRSYNNEYLESPSKSEAKLKLMFTGP